MTDRFKNAIDALVHAFFNDTLAKGDCVCCAVGNIVAIAHGKKVNNIQDNPIPIGEVEGRIVYNDDWSDAFCSGQQEDCYNKDVVLYCLMPTGYSVEEMARIERAFEWNTSISAHLYHIFPKERILQDQFNGLMAVIDVLCEIEGIEDPTEHKQLFAYDN